MIFFITSLRTKPHIHFIASDLFWSCIQKYVKKCKVEYKVSTNVSSSHKKIWSDDLARKYLHGKSQGALASPCPAIDT